MTIRSKSLPAVLSILASMAFATPSITSSAEKHKVAEMTTPHSLRHSLAQLTALELKIARQGHYWQAHGVELGQREASPAADKVVIQLRLYNLSAKRQLLHYYSLSWVYVSSMPDLTHVTPAGGYADQAPSDRFKDFSPFWGGDVLFYNTHTPSAFCTTGFAVTGKKHRRYMITAGHCGFHTWYTNLIKKYYIGKTVEQGIPSGVDAQLISGEQYGNSAWGNGSTQFPIAGIFLAKKGDELAFSGSVTGLRKNVKVIDKLPFCAYVGGFDICGLMRAQANNRKVCAVGDSGGPVFKIESGDKPARAAGIITATADSGHLCFFTAIDYITNLFHVKVDN